MKTELYFIAGNSFVKVHKEKETWILNENQVEHGFHCLATDPHHSGRMYAGTFDNGLWVSDDYGEKWRRAGAGIFHDRVLSVAVSPTEVINGYGVVWAGTEPSGLFRSEDGGETWSSCTALLDLPSKSTWRFPPRPYTHHVRSIQPDLHHENIIYVGIELGGVMRSMDKGATWEDRKPGSQFDCHTLAMNPLAKGRIYEAAGGGYAESRDGGKTWQTINEGLDPYTYLVEIAVDPANPDTIVASAAKRARTAYNHETAKTVIVRKEKNQPWGIVHDGLPEREGTTIFALSSYEKEPGVFYAISNRGIYRSSNTGKTWMQLPLHWPSHLNKARVRGMVVI